MGTLSLILSVGGDKYAMPCRRVKEVVPSVPLGRLPQVPEWIPGAFVYRGSVTLVVDLSRMLTGAACPVRLSNRIVVIEGTPGARPFGLLAERVSEIKKVEAGDGRSLKIRSASVVSGTVMDGETLVRLLDVDAILPPDLLDRTAIEEAGGP